MLVGLAVLAGLVGLSVAYANGVFMHTEVHSAMPTSGALPNVAAETRRLVQASVVASPSAVAASPSAVPSSATGPLQAGGCPSRFPPFFLRYPKWKPIAPCVSATGMVVSVALQRDGDYHVDIIPDPGSRWLLNSANLAALGGLLRTEIVPQSELAGVSVTTPLPPPRPGTHVRISGAEVLDVGHAGWTEIHPVYSWSTI